jgi:hypothetical protein
MTLVSIAEVFMQIEFFFCPESHWLQNHHFIHFTLFHWDEIAWEVALTHA